MPFPLREPKSDIEQWAYAIVQAYGPPPIENAPPRAAQKARGEAGLVAMTSLMLAQYGAQAANMLPDLASRRAELAKFLAEDLPASSRRVADNLNAKIADHTATAEECELAALLTPRAIERLSNYLALAAKLVREPDPTLIDEQGVRDSDVINAERIGRQANLLLLRQEGRGSGAAGR